MGLKIGLALLLITNCVFAVSLNTDDEDFFFGPLPAHVALDCLLFVSLSPTRLTFPSFFVLMISFASCYCLFPAFYFFQYFLTLLFYFPELSPAEVIQQEITKGHAAFMHNEHVTQHNIHHNT